MSATGESKSGQDRFLEEMERVQAEAKRKTPEELVMIYKGIPYPSCICSEETFCALESLEAREDDLLIVTYPKCGTNWVIRILHEMLFFIGGKEPSIDQAMIELGNQKKYRLLKKHLHQECFQHICITRTSLSHFWKRK
eukprot:XP_012819191.1 PREDICTED: sulfotransferase 6B1-like [Xenopus tropicalis]